jgi:hypothetical protein
MKSKEDRFTANIIPGNYTCKVYDKVLLSMSQDGPIEDLMDFGCNHVSNGGTLLFVYTIEVPSQLPYMYADTQKEFACKMIEKGLRHSYERNVKFDSRIITARYIPEAILEEAAQNNSRLIIMCRRHRDIFQRIFLKDDLKKVRKRFSGAFIGVNY